MNKQPINPSHYIVDFVRYNSPRNSMVAECLEHIKTYAGRFFLADELHELKVKIRRELNLIVNKHPRCRPWTYDWMDGISSHYQTLSTPDGEWTVHIKPAHRSSVWSEE